MSVIYQPKGRAGEYGGLACNLFSTCSHACLYCYVPGVLHVTREKFHKPAVPRKDILQRLEKDARARQKRREGGQVFLCFTCDPYPVEDVEPGITRRAIEILHETGHTVRVLTKGGSRALRDLDLFGPGDAFGVTLTIAGNSEMSKKWEPGAASTEERMKSLLSCHLRGIPTWVSLEPVIDPDSALWFIRHSCHYVDHWKVGAMNYHPHAKTTDWPKFAREVVETLESVGAKYTLKDDLKKYLEVS